jgi:uncharacterized protein YhfF
MPEYFAVVCDLCSSANWCGWTSERHEEKELFIKFGSASVVTKGDEMPQCVICYEMRANEPLKVN